MASSLFTLRDGICQWFGGAYDPVSRSYRIPQVPGLGVVRRARPKSVADTDFYVGAPSTGAIVGSWMLVHVGTGRETRLTFAGTQGSKQLVSTCTLHVFMRSTATLSEDAQDGFYELLDALKDRIRADPRMGSGGFENGGFEVGEAGTQGVRWQMSPAESESEMTTGYLMVTFDAIYFETG